MNEENPIVLASKGFGICQVLMDPQGYFAALDPLVDLYMDGLKADEKPKSNEQLAEEEEIENLKKKVWLENLIYLSAFIL